MVVCFGVDQRRPISRPTWPIVLSRFIVVMLAPVGVFQFRVELTDTRYRSGFSKR